MVDTLEAKGAVFEQEATVKDWDDDYYHPSAIALYDRAVPWMLKSMGAKPGDVVLDAGCGPGVHAIRAAKYGCQVHAIDMSETMLRHAHERADEAGLTDQISFETANLLSFHPARKYQYIFSWGVIIHIPQTDEALENLANAVAPGGSLGLHLLMEGSADFWVERFARTLLRKPLKDRKKTSLGTGNWYSMNGERLWVLRFNLTDLDARMISYGFQRVGHRAAEATELQRRLKGWPRKALLRFNDIISRHNVLPKLSATQILVYQKSAN